MIQSKVADRGDLKSHSAQGVNETGSKVSVMDPVVTNGSVMQTGDSKSDDDGIVHEKNELMRS